MNTPPHVPFLVRSALEALRQNPGPSLRAYHSPACRSLFEGTDGEEAVHDGLTFSPSAGAFFAPASSPLRPRLRRLTWEDTLRRDRLRLDSDDANYGLNAVRGTWYCRRRRACDALGMPMAIGTVQRPTKGFVLRRHGHAFFGLTIEKSGMSTLGSVFTTARLRKAGARGWKSPEILGSERCRNATNGQLIEETARRAMESLADVRSGIAAVPTAGAPRPVEQLTACGHASSFDLDPAMPTFSFAVVRKRDPLSRFISACIMHTHTHAHAHIRIQGARPALALHLRPQ